MYYKFRSNILFRNYVNYGYVTDDRNYRYIKDEVVGDRVVSESGAVFLSALSKKPTSIINICRDIQAVYKDIDIELIKNDVEDFFSELVRDGFLCKGDSVKECDNNDYFFSYTGIKRQFKPEDPEERGVNSVRFLEEHNDGISVLTSVHIEITGKCNERCIHCYIPHGNKIKTLKSKYIYDVLKQCWEMNVLHITLSGGEPMLHKDFPEILRVCREYNFAVSILTNLTLLTDDILDEIKLNGALGVQTSLYSMDATVHDSITKMTGSFTKTKSAISKLIAYDIPLQISCPIMKKNKESYQDVIQWAKERGLGISEDYALIAEYDHSNKNINARLSTDEVGVILEENSLRDKGYLNKLRKEYLSRETTDPEAPVCSVCHFSVCIAENGNVYPCAGWQDCVLGNIKKTSLREIWYHSEKGNYLRSLQKKDFPQCMQCDSQNICNMCMVRNANEDPCGDPLKVNTFFCEITKLKRDLVR